MISKIDVINLALDQLGVERISSLEDETEQAGVATAAYRTVRRSLLGRHDWSFALASQDLAELTEEPIPPYTHVMALPADFVRLVAMLSCGSVIPAISTAGRVHADTAEVTALYVAEVDESASPSSFDEALVAALAARMASPLTSSSSMAANMERAAMAAYILARRVDLESSTSMPATHPLLDTRH